MITLFEDANKLLEKVKMELSVQIRNCFETITRNASNPLSSATNQRPQYNQRERGIPDHAGNPAKKLPRRFPRWFTLGLSEY